MDTVDRFVYTVGLGDEEIDAQLREHDTGVLALADGGRAYAVPVSHAVADDGTVYLRLGDDGASEKLEFLRASREVCYVVHDEGVDSEEDPDSWSVQLRGTLEEVDAEDAPEDFDVFHVFEEDIADVTLRYFHFETRTRTGRKASE